MVKYNDILGDHLSTSTWLRHLFNKIGTVVEVDLGGAVIKGVLKTIDVVFKSIEIDTGNEVYFINWRNVYSLKAEKTG